VRRSEGPRWEAPHRAAEWRVLALPEALRLQVE
jgi:hypothetical protein